MHASTGMHLPPIMRLHLILYRGIYNELIPKDVAHIVADDSVNTIKKSAFFGCSHLKSISMGNSVRRIENCAFWLVYWPNFRSSFEGFRIHWNMCFYSLHVEYEGRDDGGTVTDASICKVYNWLIGHMDGSPFYKLCYDDSLIRHFARNQ
jgi:hypothetical protein